MVKIYNGESKSVDLFHFQLILYLDVHLLITSYTKLYLLEGIEI